MSPHGGAQYAYLSQARYPYFKQAFIVSIFFHLILFITAALAPLLPIFQGKRGLLKYSSTIRVDIIDLPDQLIREVNENIAATQDAIRSLRKEVEHAYEDKDALKFKSKKEILKQQTTSAIDRLKALQGLEKKEEAQKKEIVRKGNIVSAGAEGIPEERGVPLGAYQSMVYEKVKLRWALPSYLRRLENLSGEVIIYLDHDGFIIRKQIVSSGNSEFDDFMNRALEEALPFPSVPQEVQKDLRYDGISMKFYAEELK